MSANINLNFYSANFSLMASTLAIAAGLVLISKIISLNIYSKS